MIMDKECVGQSNSTLWSLPRRHFEPWNMERARLASSRMEAARRVTFLTVSFIFRVTGTGGR